MIRKQFFLALLIGVSGLSSAYADFSLYWRDQNYFVSEFRRYRGLDLDSAKNPLSGNIRSFATLKLRMKPSLAITDRLSVHSLFDVFTNPYATHATEDGGVYGQQQPDGTNYGPALGNLPQTIFGSANGFGRTSGGDTTNFFIKQGYLEYISDWGILKMGRMPRHWGLGILYNAGDRPLDKFGNRTDSVFYELSLGNIKLAAIYSKLVEGPLLDSFSDDVTQYETYFHWNDPEKDVDIGGLYAYMRGGNNFLRLHYIDGYVAKRWRKWRLGVEGVFGTGQPGGDYGNTTQQVGVASELSYAWNSKFTFYAKGGYASGPDRSAPTTLKLFAFNRNYDVAQIMFNQAVGVIPAQTGIVSSSNPDVNAVFNAIYGSGGGDYHFNDRIGLNLNYVYAQAVEAFNNGGDKAYGQEVDLNIWYQFLENLRLNLNGGVFFPGSLYSGSPLQTPARATDTAYSTLGSAVLTF